MTPSQEAHKYLPIGFLAKSQLSCPSAFLIYWSFIDFIWVSKNLIDFIVSYLSEYFLLQFNFNSSNIFFITPWNCAKSLFVGVGLI